MEKGLSHIRLVSEAARGVIEPPKPTATHFFTAGKVLSFFPTVNENGMTFFKEDISDEMVQTLVGSTVDIQHVKPGYNISDASVKGSNATIGAITVASKTEDGIEILTKLERTVVSALGFSPEDFEPGVGRFAKYSQECDYLQSDAKFIAVDKSDPTKVVATLDYADGVERGLRPSVVGKDGKWEMCLFEGNPVYLRVKPVSFSGAGHVHNPADPSAQTFKMAASKGVSFMPGMDQVSDFPADMVWNGSSLTPEAEGNIWATDITSHPDILTADVDKFHDEMAKGKEDDPKLPDSHYAACFSEADPSNVTNGSPKINRTRLFRIKDNKGNLDRSRLIACYQCLMGSRGHSQMPWMPSMVKAHALAVVRRGLKMTKPDNNTTKEISSKMETNPEIEALNAQIAKLREESEKAVSAAVHQSVVSERDALKAEVEKLTASLKEVTEEKATLVASLGEFKEKELSSARFAELEAVLPFSDEEKNAETFAEYVKGLARLSDDGIAIEKLRRENAKLNKEVAAQKAVSSRNPGFRPVANPVPTPEGVEEVAIGLGDIY
jgi:hypothetical protein